ncbi:FUSC family protein [Paenibacillus sp. TRM 82003]|uniref:FUSC family protein n=1 Tax=Kineococcus sp. TRM81007 TaxID=2925831 RepID=UPI001F5758AF|nr:FUSC family protein [Kineococcus sp. TRM81007]MCI2237191.1 FUSC family protein [Kineococcus sp. TRM81007]MCI3925312.1 FUSC family protein [Paenibacillus sp. TRM 82003]
MPRTAPLAVAVRRRARTGWQRWQGSWWQVLQCGLGAGVAWTLARALWDQAYPVFACVAVVVCLGVQNNARLRRVAELGVGVTVGVLLGTAVVHLIGRGAWQISLIVVAAMLIARFLDSGMLLVNQAALQATFIVAFPPQPGGGSARWLDAMTGVVVALAIAALLPSDPRRDVRARAAAFSGQLADLLDDAAEAVRARDAGAAAAVLERARGTQRELDAWAQSVSAALEVQRLSPLRRRGRAEVREQQRLQSGVDRATRNARVALRRVTTALEYGEQLPDPLAGVMHSLAASVRSLGQPPYPGETAPPSAATLRELAAQLGPRTLGAESLSATVVVAQLRSVVVDLLQAQGVPPAETHRLLPR